MDRKSVWIDGREVFVLPWARVWDVLMAAPSSVFQDIWNGRSEVIDENGCAVDPDGELSAGQRLFVRKRDQRKVRAAS